MARVTPQASSERVETVPSGKEKPEQTAADAFLEQLLAGKRLAKEAARLTELATRKRDVIPDERYHEQIADVLRRAYGALGFDLGKNSPASVTTFERYYKDGLLTGISPSRDRSPQYLLSDHHLISFFVQNQLRANPRLWSTDVEGTPLSYSIAAPIAEDSPLAVFEIRSYSIRGKDRHAVRRRYLEGALEKLVELLSGGDPDSSFYVEKNPTGTRARLFAVFPGIPGISALQTLADEVTYLKPTRIYVSGGGSMRPTELPHGHRFSIAGRYAPGSSGRSPLTGREQSQVDGSVASIEDLFDVFIEAAEHPVPTSVAETLLCDPEPVSAYQWALYSSPRSTSYLSSRWEPSPPEIPTIASVDAAPATQGSATDRRAEAGKKAEPSLALPFKPPPKLPPETWRSLYDLGLDLRPGKRKNARVLPVRPGAERTKPEAVSLMWWPWYTRLVYGLTSQYRNEYFVAAAEVNGAGVGHILFREILPNTVSSVLTKMSLDVGWVIIIGSMLSFVGLGVQPPEPSLGSMVADGARYLPDQWWIAVFPALAIVVVVMGFNLFGDGVRDMFASEEV